MLNVTPPLLDPPPMISIAMYLLWKDSECMHSGTVMIPNIGIPPEMIIPKIGDSSSVTHPELRDSPL